MPKNRKPKPQPKAPAAPVDKLAALRKKAVTEGLLYTGSEKHRDPRQPGKRGSLCPPAISIETAQAMMLDSLEFGGARYAVHEGHLYEARDDGHGHWHGYPVGWVEVSETVRAHFRKSGLVKNRDLGRFWKK